MKTLNKTLIEFGAALFCLVLLGCFAYSQTTNPPSIRELGSPALTTNQPGTAPLPGTSTNTPTPAGALGYYVLVDTNFALTWPPFLSGNFRGSYSNSFSHIALNGTAAFTGLTVTTLSGLTVSGAVGTFPILSATYETLATNDISLWPSAPNTPGGCDLVNSNGTLYALISGPNGASWISTNKLAGP